MAIQNTNIVTEKEDSRILVQKFQNTNVKTYTCINKLNKLLSQNKK